MSDAFTPDEEQVRDQYTQEQPPQIGSVAEKRAEFDRFIARIKAEAWDEGYEAAARYHDLDTEFAAPNPYREEGGTVNWDAQSDRAAIRYYSDWCPDGIQEAHRRGARWQREALLSEETVMRAARAVYESAPNTWTWTWAEIVGGWKNKPYPDYPHLVDDIRRQARAALAAALGEDEGNE